MSVLSPNKKERHMRCKIPLKLLMIAVLVFSIGQLSYAEGDMAQIGTVAPDLILPQVDGDPITLSEEIAKYDVILLYFFYAAT
jgi:hypothetical protein